MKKIILLQFLIFSGLSAQEFTTVADKVEKSTEAVKEEIPQSLIEKSTEAVKEEIPQSLIEKSTEAAKEEIPLVPPRPPQGTAAAISVKPRFTGRLSLQRNPEEKIKGNVWRFSEKPENIAGVNFGFKIPSEVSGEIDLRVITNEENQTDRYYTKWYYWTVSFNSAFLRVPLFGEGGIIAYHNADFLKFEKPIVNFTPLNLYGTPRFADWQELFNPFENNLSYKIDEVPLGVGTQGFILSYSDRLKIFFADDNTTKEISDLKVDPETGRVILDQNENKILDINEQDAVHHNTYGARLKIPAGKFETNFTATVDDVFRWEDASLKDPWDKGEAKTNEELLYGSGISTDTKIAERFARNARGSIDFKFDVSRNFVLRGEVSASQINQKYVSKPSPTKIDALLYETKKTSVDIPFNGGAAGGLALAGDVKWSGRYLSLLGGWQMREKSYDFDIISNPHILPCPENNRIYFAKLYFHKSGKRLIFSFAQENYSVFNDTGVVKKSAAFKNLVFRTKAEADLSSSTFWIDCQFLAAGGKSLIQSQLWPDLELETSAEDGASLLAGAGFIFKLSEITSLNVAYFEEYVKKWTGDSPLRKALFEMKVKL